MTYVCVRCGKLWTEGNPTDEYSGGICLDCIVYYLKSKGHCFDLVVRDNDADEKKDKQ